MVAIVWNKNPIVVATTHVIEMSLKKKAFDCSRERTQLYPYLRQL